MLVPLFTIAVLMWTAEQARCEGRHRHARPSPQGVSGKKPLVQRLVRTTRNAVRIAHTGVPALTEAISRLRRPGCAAAVGGKHARNAGVRAETTTYYEYPPGSVTAEEILAGRFATVYALSNPTERYVLLFPAFFRPAAILTRMLSGGVEQMNLIGQFEAAHGFHTGAVTPILLQVLLLLHEKAHLNGTAIQDLSCPMLSMMNTRYVAEACIPEILDPAPARMVQLGRVGSVIPRFAASVHARACSACHSDVSTQ